MSAVRDPIESTLLHDIAAGIAAAEPLWRPVVVHDPDQRHPVRLLATPVYEVWVIGWAPGQRADLHDHGDAAGAMTVVEGVLTEDAATTRGLRREKVRVGEVLDLPVGLVHEIANTGEEVATSIHVYSPPLRTMTRYDHGSLAPTITDIIPPEDPVFDATAVSAARHPSVAGG